MPHQVQPLVTVVLPTYNRAHTLGTSLSSVLAQTYANIELIVIDDASTDATASMVSAISDPRVKYVRLSQNGGAAAARNRGVSLASGEFVFFQDSDDIWLPHKIERQMASYRRLASSHQSVVGDFCRYVKLCGGSALIVPRDRDLADRVGLFHDVILDHNIVGTPTLMVRTDALRSVGGFDESLSTDEDWDLALELTRNNRLSFTDEILVCSINSPDGVNKNPRAANVLRIIEKNWAALSRNTRSHALLLTVAANDHLENNRVGDASAVARQALSIRPSLRNLLIGVCPRPYMALRRLRRLIRGGALRF